MPAGSKWTIYGGQIIYMSKKPWTSGKNTLIFNIFQYHSHFIDVPENTGFMGFYSISCLQNMQYAGLSVVIPVESRKSKRKLDTRTLIPSAESRILFQICVTFFFLCITAVQLLPTVTTLCVYRLQCWKSRFFFNNFRTRERQGLQQYQPAYQRHQRQKGMAKLGIEGAMVAFDFPGFDTNVSFKTKLHDSKFNSSYEMTKPTYHLQILFIFFLLSQVSWWVSGKQKTHI